MKIRLATMADASHIAAIHTASWRDTYKKALTATYLAEIVPQERAELWANRLSKAKPNQYVLVAEYDDVIVGFACFYLAGNADFGSYLDNLHVAKSHQAKGIGKCLLLAGASRCTQQEPAQGLCLLVNQDNFNAQAFYKRLGAENVKDSIWYAPDGSNVPTYWFVWRNINVLVANGQSS